MFRILEIASFNYTPFNENNWTFYLKEIFPFFKSFFNFFSEELLFLSDTILHSPYSINLLYFSITYQEFINLNLAQISKTVTNLLTQLSNYNNFLLVIDLNNFFLSNQTFNLNLFYFFNFFITLTFLFFIFFIFYLNFHNDYGTILENYRTIFIMFYEEFILIWTRFASIKFESYEEALCILILWPWCIFLVFTHIFSSENNEIFFIFVEWGLPVVYGYLILIESIWLFGNFFFVYLNGARGRKLLLVTFIEDLISFAILLARVTLQMVRGIICGLYHDFFREITEYIIDTWEMYWFYANWQLPFLKNSFLFDLTLFFIDWYIIVFILLFIYIILFLQLLFLVIAVWLFCRCWFISTKIAKNKFYFYYNLNNREKNMNFFFKNLV